MMTALSEPLNRRCGSFGAVVIGAHRIARKTRPRMPAANTPKIAIVSGDDVTPAQMPCRAPAGR